MDSVVSTLGKLSPQVHPRVNNLLPYCECKVPAIRHEKDRERGGERKRERKEISKAIKQSECFSGTLYLLT